MNKGELMDIEIGFHKLSKWQWAGLILVACIISAGLAAGSNTFFVNVTLEQRLQALEDQVNIPVNSTISAMIKESSYIVSQHNVSGTMYTCLINGTDDRAGRLEYYDTDAATVIQAAINAGICTYVKEGEYTISDTITISSANHKLVGSGFGTIFKAANNLNKDIFRIGTGNMFIQLQDFQIDGNSANNTSGRGISLGESGSSTWVWFTRLRIRDCKQNALYSKSTSPSSGCYFVEGCRFSDAGGAGQHLVNLNGVADVQLINNHFGGSGSGYDIIILNNCARVVIAGNYIDYGGQHGVDLYNCKYCRVLSNQIEYNQKHGVRIAPVSAEYRYNIIEGNNIALNNRANAATTDGINVDSTYNTIVGNCITDTTPYHRYGIREGASADYNVIKANVIDGVVTGGILKVGANTIVRNNIGHKTENSGSSTGTGAQQTIAHGLAVTPTRVYITPTATGVTEACLSAPSDETNIYVTVTNLKTYMWYAEG